MTTVAVTRVTMKGYERPDTASQFEGLLAPGRYIVDEMLEGYPDGATDFARVQAPALGAGDTWICTRRKNEHFATIETEAPTLIEQQDFAGVPGAIWEAALVARLQWFNDFRYDLDEARYPYALTGVNVPLSPPATNNCCTFVEALLVKAWCDELADFTWSAARHRQMMILSNDDYFSPVTAVVESGMGMPVPDPDRPPHPWTVVQGWRHQWRGGHTFICVDHHAGTDRVLTLESNSNYLLNGVGFRAIGNLRDVGGRPPPEWWHNEALWTWQRICATYRYRQQAWLKVRDRSWSGLQV